MQFILWRYSVVKKSKWKDYRSGVCDLGSHIFDICFWFGKNIKE